MRQVPRVVYVDHVARLSGAEIALVRLLRALGDSVDAHVVLGEDGPLVPQLEAAGARVTVLLMDEAARDVRKDTVRPGAVQLSAAWATARYVWRLARLLRAERPDIVHTNSLKACVYGGLAGRLARVPVVWHARDRIARDYLPQPAVVLVRVLSRVLPAVVVANSQATLATLRPSHAGAVVYNAVVPDAVEPTALRRGGGAGPLTVGVVGRLSPWKGQDVFLRAFARAFPDGQERARLIGSAMFGEDAYEQQLRDLVHELRLEDRVEFRGFRTDVLAELEQLDVVVHCSTLPEPFGQVVVEGMSLGLPVVASDAGGPAEIVTDGEDGLLTPPGDVGALATALSRLAQDPELRERLGAAGQQASARFSPQATAEAMHDVYRRVLAPR